MDVTAVLEKRLEQISQCSAEEYLHLSGDIAREVISLPEAAGDQIRTWVEHLYQRVKSGEATADLLGPFVQGLAGRRDGGIAELLGQIMLDENTQLTEEIVDLMSDMGAAARPAVPALMQLLSRPDDEQVRTKAAFALGCAGDLRAQEGLRAALTDGDSDLRYAALDALRRLNARLPLDRLSDILANDSDGLVRAAAARALDQWYGDQARTVLEQQMARERHADALRVLKELLAPSHG